MKAPPAKIESYQVLLAGGFYCEFLNLGGIVRKLVVPCALDAEGRAASKALRDVVLGYENLEDYRENPAYLGAVIGRYANRIPQGVFKLEGKKYQLDCQNGAHLHGGVRGFSHQFFQVEKIFQTSEEALFELSLVSPEEPDSYPAKLEVKMLYHFLSFAPEDGWETGPTQKHAGKESNRPPHSPTKPQPRFQTQPPFALKPKGELRIHLKALPDKKTPLNLTHHSYFQLNGVGNFYALPEQAPTSYAAAPEKFWQAASLLKKAPAELEKIFGHSFQIFSDRISEVAEGFVWSGRDLKLDSKPAYDFRQRRSLEPDLLEQDPDLKLFGGIDNNYKTGEEGELKLQAYALAKDEKIGMAVGSSLPDLQFYSAGSLQLLGGKDHQAYPPLSAFCFEPQFAPNSLNLFADEKTLFSPTKIFDHTIVYSFFG